MEFHYFDLNIPPTEVENHKGSHTNEEAEEVDVEENARDFDLNEPPPPDGRSITYIYCRLFHWIVSLCDSMFCY